MKARKLSDKQFWAILRENAGLYARTARAIRKHYDIEMSRQNVRQRAMERPDELDDIREENLDVAEEGLHSLMRSNNQNIQLRAIEVFLKAHGKSRGYVERKELTGAEGEPLRPFSFKALFEEMAKEEDAG